MKAPTSDAPVRRRYALTPKQQRFVEEYLVDLNATRAARAAGYSGKNADKIGSQLLGKTRVQAAIQAGRQELAARSGWTRERIIGQLQPIAEFAFADVLDWSGERLALRPAHEIPEAVRRSLGNAIASVKLRPVSRQEERALGRLRQAARRKDYDALTTALKELPAGPGEATLEIIEFKLYDRLAALAHISRLTVDEELAARVAELEEHNKAIEDADAKATHPRT
ncbi:MAG: terminase small subunit [Candidatus Binatia bacterium]